jgi:glycerol 2-dehydrogenase (NADP+)
LYKNKTLLDLAEQKGKTVQQVLLVWGLQKGWSVIPKSSNEERIVKNFDINGWELTSNEMEIISSMKERFKVCSDAFLPDSVSVFDGDDE